MDITIQTTIEIPSVPSTLKVISAGKGSKSIDVGDLSDDQLTELANQWKAKLLKHAAKRRAPQSTPPK